MERRLWEQKKWEQRLMENAFIVKHAPLVTVRKAKALLVWAIPSSAHPSSKKIQRMKWLP